MLVFRLPFEAEFYTTNGSSDKISVCFFSFDSDQKISFPGKIIPFEEENLQQYLPENHLHEISESHEDYLKKIEKAISFIQENQLPKLVIARKKTVEISEMNLVKTLQNLAKKYPSAFVYAFTDGEELWMGAFSELLGKFDKKNGIFETMSLAGTLPVDEEWTTKEIEEQKPVTAYISNILKKYSSEVRISETYDHISGNIKHLRTDFSAPIEEEQLEKLISELHPTPAVCGIPKDFCLKAIQNFEHFNREYYAGYSRTETEDFIYFFVNLRCGKFSKNKATLYVGGGITAMSNPEKEWRETELKSEALLRHLIFCGSN